MSRTTSDQQKAPSRPGTGVRDRGRQTVEDILDASVRLVIEEGYAGLSLRRVAERAEIRLSNLQYYFPNREGLLEAVMSREFVQRSAEFEAAIGRSQLKPKGRLLATIDFVLKDQDSAESCVLFWELWAMAVREPAVAAVMDAFYARYVDVFARLVEDLNPDLGRAVVRRRAAAIVALLEGASVLRGTRGAARAAQPGLEQQIRESCLAICGQAA